MYKITLGLRHTLPFNNLSLRFPGAVVYRWCNTTVDYLEIDCGARGCGEVAAWLAEYASREGLRLTYEYSSPTRISVVMNCNCSPANSTLRMAEECGCLWRAPVTYFGGEETFELIVFDYKKFEELFEKYEELGEAKIKRKVHSLVGAINDLFTLNLNSVFSSLTKKQIRVLEEAIARGYYGAPKKTTIRELAAALGLSEATTQEHLSRAEAKIMGAIAPYLKLYTHTPSFPEFLQAGFSEKTEQ